MVKKKVRPKRRKKIAQKNQIPLLSFILIIILLFFVFTTQARMKQARVSQPLAYLYVPKVARVHLPPPLELPSYTTSVLGAQTIDPKDIVKYVNLEREKRGIKPLRLSQTLIQAAQMRADVILKYQNFSHQDPHENIELATVLPKLNYHFVYASENIGMGGVSGETFVYGFMNSTSHRENLLNPELSDTGAAVVTGPYKQYYVNIAVQLFAVPGGKDEYLGYSQAEIKKYKQLLTGVESQLNPLIWMVGRFLGNKSYTDERHQKLIRQQEILTAIYDPMSQEKPLQNDHVALILEYNENLKSI